MTTALQVGTAGIFGIVVGSFLNVCIDRLPVGKSIISPPSHCPGCQRELTPLELIPIISFIILQGKCRTCGEKIPLRSLLVEIGTGALFSLVWWSYGPGGSTVLYLVYTALLILIAVIDLEHKRILNILIYPAIILALASLPVLHAPDLFSYILGAGSGFLVLFLIAVISPGAMGMGDVKLVLFLGLITGFPEILLLLFTAFVIGGLTAGILLALGKVDRKDPIAFGPYLALAGMITLLYGETILSWWLRRVGL